MLGPLRGGGYEIESKIPELGQGRPQGADGRQPVVLADDAPPPEAQQAARTAPPAEAAATALKKIAEQPELAYKEGLSLAETRQAQAAQQAARARELAKAAEQRAAEKAKHQQQAAATKPAAEKEKSSPQDNARFSYVFQVASYKDKTYADRFAATIKKQGYKVRTEKSVEKGVNWYRVVLDFTGNSADVAKLESAMRGHGISKMLLRSKKAVRGR